MADTPGRQGETPKQRIDRLVAEGKILPEAVARALHLWHSGLRHGVAMPNGQYVAIELNDIYHALTDPRIWRRPERIERMLRGVFELRTSHSGRTAALCRWEEDSETFLGFVILEGGNRLWSIHVVDERKIRRMMRRGILLWRP